MKAAPQFREILRGFAMQKFMAGYELVGNPWLL